MLESLKVKLMPDEAKADIAKIPILMEALQAQNDALRQVLDRLKAVEEAHEALKAEHKVTQDALLAQGNVVLAHRDVLTRWAAESATLRGIEEKHAKAQQREAKERASLLEEAEQGVIRMETRVERRARRRREHLERVAQATAVEAGGDPETVTVEPQSVEFEGISQAAPRSDTLVDVVAHTDNGAMIVGELLDRADRIAEDIPFHDASPANVAIAQQADAVRQRLLTDGVDPDLVEGIVAAGQQPSEFLEGVQFIGVDLAKGPDRSVRTPLPEIQWKTGDGDE